MGIWIIAFLLTACELLVVSENIISDPKYTVSFFQFNSKDLGTWGKGRAKKDMKRSAVEPANNTLINSTTPNTGNATASNSSSNVGNNTASVTETNLTNGTILKVTNNTDVMLHGNSTTPALANDTDINIMNTLISMSVNNQTAGGRSNLKGENKSSKNSSIYEASNMTNNASSTKSNIAGKDAHATRKKFTLNPNPSPSENEAALNLKAPVHIDDGKGHSATILKDTSKKNVKTENSETKKTNKISMEKNVHSKQSNPLIKSENDKLANHIKEGAKQIQSVTNQVGPVDISNKEQKKEQVHKGNANQPDEKKLKLRKKLAKFVPLYKTTPKDHALSFQVGSLKHPQHDMHPKCHACPLNSTYKECVKKSTLHDCSTGLDNICFTKSTKKHGVITYQMGCTDHKKCTKARAFPCKDDTEHCFTCCQFDRCNSSPHHGDYELDELNLAELDTDTLKSKDMGTVNLDTKSSTVKIDGSWMAYACSILIMIILQ